MTRDEAIICWMQEYGVETEGFEGLDPLELLAEWTTTCKGIACDRMGMMKPTKEKVIDVTGKVTKAPMLKASDRVWPEIWYYTPVGHTFYAMRIPPDELTKGGLIIPDSGKQKNHEGWLVNISPEVGFISPEAPYQSPVNNPLDLVGRVVTWGEYAGRVLAETAIDNQWDGEYLQLSMGELLSVKLGGK